MPIKKYINQQHPFFLPYFFSLFFKDKFLLDLSIYLLIFTIFALSIEFILFSTLLVYYPPIVRSPFTVKVNSEVFK